jgi:hypothetical protein
MGMLSFSIDPIFNLFGFGYPSLYPGPVAVGIAGNGSNAVPLLAQPQNQHEQA